MSIFRHRALLVALPLAVLAACSDSPSGPEEAAQRMARRFDVMADSLFEAGQYDAADGALAMGEVLRMSDRLGTVTVHVDGAPRTYYALLLQFQMPSMIEEDEDFGQAIVAWQGESLNQGFAFAMDSTGTLAVASPEMVLARATGGMFEGNPETGRVWLATSGSVVTARATERSGCASSQLLPPSMDYDCRLATLTFRANVTLREVDQEGELAPGAASRTLLIDGQPVGGIALTIHALPEGVETISPRRILPGFLR